jgi:hypothetical protein
LTAIECDRWAWPPAGVQAPGWSEVPTIRLEHLSEAQKWAFMIADNRLTEIALWDDRLLAEQL